MSSSSSTAIISISSSSSVITTCRSELAQRELQQGQHLHAVDWSVHFYVFIDVHVSPSLLSMQSLSLTRRGITLLQSSSLHNVAFAGAAVH
jgi:hypothetical protein